ncbi:ABC transporter substrate-binding protein [Plantactinospora solaniradicis]|uniref:ABC transporter substrate-binding protein n=1 Tax=Plantactinospora solaniradicis TaxID=1723736 RepID=A0ABW1K6L9_9ACTN
MKTFLTTAVVGGVVLALAACGGGDGSGDGSGGQQLVNGKTFTMVLGSDPGNLDPHFTSLASAQQVDRFLYDSLLNVDEKGTIVAGLAEKWEATTTTATFTLRKGITCSDGTPLTATQVAENISFVGKPDNASTRLGLFVPAGATATADDAAGVVTVTSPNPASFLALNVGSLHIVCGKGFADRGLLARGADGTGMFTVTEAVADDHYTLTRRKDYAWGPGDWKTDQQGLPDKVVFRIVANETTAANLLISGEVNAVQLVGADKQRLQSMRKFQREVVAPLGELWFNQKPGMPGADEAVRRALTQALDLNQLGQVLSSGTGKASTSLVAPRLSPCSENTVGTSLPGHDVAAAKSALDAAGWTAGADGVRAKGGTKLSMTFYYPTSVGPTLKAGAELLQKLWGEVGVQVTLRSVTDAEIGELIVGGKGTWGATFLPLSVTLPTELVPFLSGPTPPNGSNFSGIQNEQYAAAVREASAIAGAAGCAKWAEAERALFQHVDVVPFVDSTVPTFGSGATYELTRGSVAPSSVRMLG